MAITEAAQSRLTFIHGSRDDLTEEAYRGGSGHAELLSFFHELAADTSWGSLDDLSTDDLVADYERVLAGLRDLGFEGVYAIDLSRPGIPVSVVKTLIPGATCPRRI